MADAFAYRRRVEFADTDTAGMSHFTSLFRYMEEAEHAFYRSLGAVAFEWREDGVVGMPRVAVSGEFLAPVRYGDEVEVRLIVRRVGTKSIHYAVEIARMAPGDPVAVARGTMTVVFAARRHGEREYVGVELPKGLRARLEAVRDGEPG